MLWRLLFHEIPWQPQKSGSRLRQQPELPCQTHSLPIIQPVPCPVGVPSVCPVSLGLPRFVPAANLHIEMLNRMLEFPVSRDFYPRQAGDAH